MNSVVKINSHLGIIFAVLDLCAKPPLNYDYSMCMHMLLISTLKVDTSCLNIVMIFCGIYKVGKIFEDEKSGSPERYSIYQFYYHP